ncbi:hypothetical protein FRB95_013717 [Tulasnella sp. JGI-2019a]|nr:hypothetical protein FRB95_013717 [Tulasnella sp. JGI-2019a]
MRSSAHTQRVFLFYSIRERYRGVTRAVGWATSLLSLRLQVFMLFYAVYYLMLDLGCNTIHGERSITLKGTPTTGTLIAWSARRCVSLCLGVEQRADLHERFAHGKMPGNHYNCKRLANLLSSAVRPFGELVAILSLGVATHRLTVLASPSLEQRRTQPEKSSGVSCFPTTAPSITSSLCLYLDRKSLV